MLCLLTSCNDRRRIGRIHVTNCNSGEFRLFVNPGFC